MAALARWRWSTTSRASVLDALGALDAQAIADAKSGYVMQLEPRKHKLVMDLATLVGAHYARRWFLPTPLRAVFVVAGYMAFLRAALHELAQTRLTSSSECFSSRAIVPLVQTAPRGSPRRMRRRYFSGESGSRDITR